MQQHTKVYYEYFSYAPTDFVGCECCGAKAVDIHHIRGRSFFGSKMKGTEIGMQDHISNLIALCRECHEQAHSTRNPPYEREYLQAIHNIIIR